MRQPGAPGRLLQEAEYEDEAYADGADRAEAEYYAFHNDPFRLRGCLSQIFLLNDVTLHYPTYEDRGEHSPKRQQYVGTDIVGKVEEVETENGEIA